MAYVPIYNPPVPFITHFHSGINHGTIVIVSGSVLPSADRFAVNFKCGHSENDDIAFHFSPHFNAGYVLCNTMEYNNWGQEEYNRQMPFQIGQPFEIKILVTHHEYKVSVNGVHFLEYRHRIHLHRVKTLAINGCVNLTNVEIQAQGDGFPQYPFPGGQMDNVIYPPQPGYPMQPGYQAQPGYPMQPAYAPQYPPAAGCNPIPFNPGLFPSGNYAIPYQTNIIGGLFHNKVIVIRGAVSMNNPMRFHVNLKCPGGIAFHFNPRFDEQIIVRNSYLNDIWGEEERQMSCGGMCFSPGQSFVIEIICEHHHFKVNVNGIHVCNFHHRMHHLHQIDTLEIVGDVVLEHVQI